MRLVMGLLFMYSLASGILLISILLNVETLSNLLAIAFVVCAVCGILRMSHRRRAKNWNWDD